uniref:Peptidase S1 domain-containing protein n=1 Tax=Maylandia zebra TaxID=106582 RepID=A0A3P9BK22_9CICH
MNTLLQPACGIFMFLFSFSFLLMLLALGSEIINGKIAPDNKMLYMASVQDYRGYHICGGFLVSENFVMTAAHCDNYILFRCPTYVVLGNHHLRSADKLVIQIAEKYKHPYYRDVNLGYDIMLLKVRFINFVFSHHTGSFISLSVCIYNIKTIQFIRLPLLVDVSVPFLSFPFKILLTYHMNKIHTSSLQGDSGGPLVCKGMAVGIVSFNNLLPGTELGNCNYPDVPNVYADISKHLHWIRRILEGRKS